MGGCRGRRFKREAMGREGKEGEGGEEKLNVFVSSSSHSHTLPQPMNSLDPNAHPDPTQPDHR